MDLYLDLIGWKALVVSAKAVSGRYKGKTVNPGDFKGNENRGIGDREYERRRTKK